MKTLRLILYRLCQCTWGVIQTAAGAVVFLAHIKNRHYNYHGSVVTEWKKSTSASIGMFIFITEPARVSGRGRAAKRKAFERLLVHEYGHTIQSLMLGPLYLLTMALPSAAWCFLPVCVNHRKKNKVSYFSFYTERFADYLGGRVVKRAAEKAEKRGESAPLTR